MSPKKQDPKAGAQSLVRRGTKHISQASEGQYVSFPADQVVELVILQDLEDMVSFDQHTIWLDAGGSPSFPCISQIDDCPGCELDDKPKMKSILLVAVRNEEKELVVKYWAFGISVSRELVNIEDMAGSLKGKVIRVKRTGTGFKTKYTLMHTNKTPTNLPADEDLPDVMEQIKPDNKADIIALLVEKGVLEASGKPAKPAVDDEEDEFEDVPAGGDDELADEDDDWK